MSESPEFREGRVLVGSVNKKEEPIEFWNEFRAIYITPSSILDTAEDREKGYVENVTEWFKSPLDARIAATKNSEESHSVYSGIEMTWVTRSKPERVSP